MFWSALLEQLHKSCCGRPSEVHGRATDQNLSILHSPLLLFYPTRKTLAQLISGKKVQGHGQLIFLNCVHGVDDGGDYYGGESCCFLVDYCHDYHWIDGCHLDLIKVMKH